MKDCEGEHTAGMWRDMNRRRQEANSQSTYCMRMQACWQDTPGWGVASLKFQASVTTANAQGAVRCTQPFTFTRVHPHTSPQQPVGWLCTQPPTNQPTAPTNPPTVPPGTCLSAAWVPYFAVRPRCHHETGCAATASSAATTASCCVQQPLLARAAWPPAALTAKRGGRVCWPLLRCAVGPRGLDPHS